jgi:hypothetical protein
MKYALTDTNGRVLQISDEEVEFTSEGSKVAEITDEQALEVETSSEPFFLIEGELLTIKAKLWREQPETVKELLRPERDRLLAESDWTQLNDTNIPEDKLAAWAAYRQELRDLTDSIDENGEVEFPTAP